jgi:BirA family biotin operon repressor/biotin-[acetyl-CoA-carboxylase] ligase
MKKLKTACPSPRRARFSGRGTTFNLSELRPNIKPFRLHWFSRLRSTNDHAVALRKQRKLFAPAIVLTSHQLAGRGRASNTWWSGAGSLTVTFILPAHESRPPHQVPLIAGLSVRDALAEHAGIDDIQLKWPNDLLHQGRKLAGLLCERVDGIDLIGVGVNVNADLRHAPRDLRDRITSLSTIARLEFDMTALLIDLARAIHKNLSHADEPPFNQILREYSRHNALLGKAISVTAIPGEPPLRGTCEGLDRIGRLLVRTRAGVTRVIAGHVTM